MNILYKQVETEDEYESLLSFLYSIYPKQNKEEIVANVRRVEKNNILIAIYNKKIIGSCWCLSLTFDSFNIGGIGGLAVAPDYRKCNIAKTMVEYFVDKNKKYDIFIAWTRAVGFFEKVGFKDFKYGIERLENDSTPMIKTENSIFLEFVRQNKLKRIKF